MQTIDQKKQLVFFHHALWCYAKELPQDEAILIAKISEFRNSLEQHLNPISEDAYCRFVDKGGAITLNQTII